MPSSSINAILVVCFLKRHCTFLYKLPTMKSLLIALLTLVAFIAYAANPQEICSPSSIDGGEIAFNGSFTQANNTIISVEDASGESDDIEYLWLWNPNNVSFNNGSNGWVVIEGSNSTEFEIPLITETTYYLRCSRFVGCENYWGESNVVEVPVDLCGPGSIHGGTIGFDGPYPADENIITSEEPATSTIGDVPIEYVWMSSTVNVPNTVGNPHWKVIEGSENQLEITIDGLTETTYFIRCSRVIGCEEPFWGESNTLEVQVDICIPAFIDGGEIAFEGSYHPSGENVIENVESASSLYGDLDLEYVWMSSLMNVPNTVGNPHWSPVDGSENQLELEIGGLTQTTYYIRCARIVGCDEPYWGETNTVEVTVDPCAAKFIKGGKIAFEGSYNPSGENTIENVESAYSKLGDLDIEYIWMNSLVDVPNTVGNPHWSPIEGSENQLELSISDLTQTTYYIRCARVVGCDEPYWGESNKVKVKVDPCAAKFIKGGEIEFEGPYTPTGNNVIENVESAYSKLGDLEIEYIWMSSLVNTPNVIGNPHWSPVDGSENQLELSISDLTQTTYYIRCARVVGCDDPYWGETNIVEVFIDKCAAGFIEGGQIDFDGPYNPSGNNTITNVESAYSKLGELDIEYIWMSSLINSPNVIGNPDWSPVDGSENQLELNVIDLTQTTYFIRCARVAGCDDPYWGESNVVEISLDVCAPESIDGGEIDLISSTKDGDLVLVNIKPASSQVADDVQFEYLWYMSLSNVPYDPNSKDWVEVADSQDALDLRVKGAKETFYYVRAARVFDCKTQYLASSNIIEVSSDPCSGNIDPGSISFSGPYNPSGINTILSDKDAGTGSKGEVIQYSWSQSSDGKQWVSVVGASNSTLTVSGLLVTTSFRRTAMLEGCSKPAVSNIVTIQIDPCDESFSRGGVVYFSSDEFIIRNFEEANSDFDLEFEYSWFVSTIFEEGEYDWQEIEGETGNELHLEDIEETTYFVRRASSPGCDELSVASNIVELVPFEEEGEEFSAAEEDNNFLIYPMPIQANQSGRVEFVTNSTAQMSFQLVDVNGGVKFAENVEPKAEMNKVELPTQSLTPGMYFLKIQTATGTIHKRIIIQD